MMLRGLERSSIGSLQQLLQLNLAAIELNNINNKPEIFNIKTVEESTPQPLCLRQHPVTDHVSVMHR